jgi:hypothetical protein
MLMSASSMGKHEAGFARVERDLYPTPAWVITEALAAHVNLAGMRVWECACGTGKMSEALKAAGASVYSTDIQDHGYAGLDAVVDFVDGQHLDVRFSGLVTNPPFGPRAKLAERFIEIGLQRITDCSFMALLLPTDFDSAKTRTHFFAGCPHFAGRIILTKRIVWFENPNKRESPKENTAWYLWSRNVIGGRPPIVLYAPKVPEHGQ